jgi:hypothetical protein
VSSHPDQLIHLRFSRIVAASLHQTDGAFEMTLQRNALVILAVAALAATSITPTFAKPNNGAYARSGEAFKKQMYDDHCAGLKNDLDHAEKEADARAGTKAAEKYSKLADGAWEMGHAAGCSWAA